MLGSTSSCGRATPVNASIAQPPAIHHGRVVALEQRSGVAAASGRSHGP